MRLFGSKKRNMGFDMKDELPQAVVASQRNPTVSSKPSPKKYVELGNIDYINLTPDGKHGDYEKALKYAEETGKPIFANFVEWSG